MSQKFTRVGRDVAFLAAGGAVAYAGFLALVAGVVGLLAIVVPWWAAALIVGLVVGGIGGGLVWRGLQALKTEDLTPHETLDTLRDERGEPHNVRTRATGSP